MFSCRFTALSGALLITSLLAGEAFAIDPPPREPSRFALRTNYLEEANEGIYELAFDAGDNTLFAAVTDRVNREANKGYLYAFDPASLKITHKYPLPWRAFSLALNPQQHRLYVGHTQSATLRISLVDPRSGALIKSSDRLSFNTPNAADARFEHLRHMVYSPAAGTLFVSYSNMRKGADGMQPVHKLLMLDGETLALKGEVENAYKGTAYGLTIEEKTQKIYVGGKDYVNEIDAKTRRLTRTITLKDVKPEITSLQNLRVDAASGRIFAVVFDHQDRRGLNDGLYIFDLHSGRQLGYVRTGAGANAVAYNPKHQELYVNNFTQGTVSVVDARRYVVTHTFSAPVYPNQMALSADGEALYVGVKEGFNRDWDPDVFVEGAKERVLRIDLDKS
ncbi:TieB [uncultured Pluralibacter sp.]|uniref:YncE family protein n=1 Tax=uncultured Pluralibacter sp. TaxID=1490864 RepID=UPI0026024927|nr:TieB [uncultured Pluralibacter sp.]